MKVCLSADTIGYPAGGGHLWVYLNWALGLRTLGCEVIWLEGVQPGASFQRTRANVITLQQRLGRYGLASSLAIYSTSEEPLPAAMVDGCLDLEAAAEADLLLNIRYATHPEVVGRFRRSALLDIDPGLLQIWMSTGQISVAEHDVYFTIGETVGRPGSLFPDAGLEWHHTPPCVALDQWPAHPAAAGAPFTTVSHWYADEWVEAGDETFSNDKRSGFLPYVELPRYTTLPLELALCLGSDEEEERRALTARGWRVRDSSEVASTPEEYRRYIQASAGEFSCAKPSCVRFQNAWISDRTLCYLASGKPAVVQHTGPSRFLPEAAGLFRFHNLEEAARCLETAMVDYERQCALARTLTEEYFDARKVVSTVLERALP